MPIIDKQVNQLILRNQIAKTNPLKLVVGAEGMFEPGWIGTEKKYIDLLNQSTWRYYFNKCKINAILAEHVWEHLTVQEGSIAAQNCYDYIKQGGYLRVAVPDGYHPNQDYIDYVKPGGYGNGSDDHKVLYNHETLSNIFSQVGFNVKLLEYFDSNGEFHYIDWNPDDGKIIRSKRYDKRNENGTLKYTSIILDAYKA